MTVKMPLEPNYQRTCLNGWTLRVKRQAVRTIQGIDVGINGNWERSFQWLMETAQEFQSTWQKMLAIITLCVILCHMIINFADKETERFFVTGKSRKLPPALIQIALRKLDFLNRAITLQDLRSPPLSGPFSQDNNPSSLRLCQSVIS